MLKFTKYFFFLAYNWNAKIAWHILLQEISGEKKYGINTTGADELQHLEEKGIDISHANIYMPVSYTLLEELFEKSNLLPVEPNKRFLDLGCGKGRALCVAAHYGFKKLTGLDLSKELCTIAIQNLEITKTKMPDIEYSIFQNDAFYFEIPPDVGCVFFFNPFDELIMNAVVKNISKSLRNKPRALTVIYVNPLHRSLFLKAGFTETYYSQKMKYLEVSILNKSA